jgi:hypothetical protein
MHVISSTPTRRDSSAKLFSIAAHRLKSFCTLHKTNRSHVHNSAAYFNIAVKNQNHCCLTRRAKFMQLIGLTQLLADSQFIEWFIS